LSSEVFVKRVIDGDTIVLNNGEKVRYIGIDTPERDEDYYNKAKEFNKKLVEGKTVRLETDVQQRDRYGRLLAMSLWVIYLSMLN
jgi:micrococcal nuclease